MNDTTSPEPWKASPSEFASMVWTGAICRLCSSAQQASDENRSGTLSRKLATLAQMLKESRCEGDELDEMKRTLYTVSQGDTSPPQWKKLEMIAFALEPPEYVIETFQEAGLGNVEFTRIKTVPPSIDEGPQHG